MTGLVYGCCQTLLPGKLCSTQSTHQLRIGGKLCHLDFQHFLDGLLQAGILRTAAGQSDLSVGSRLLGHDEAPLGDGHLQTGRNLILGLSFAHQRDYLRLGEDRALGRDRNHILRRQGQIRKVLQGHFEGPGHGFIELSGTGSALVIHGEVLYRTVFVHCDTLYVLPADIDDAGHRGIRHMDSHGMAADLGNIFIGERHLVSAVTGTHQICQTLCIFQTVHPGDCSSQGLRRRLDRIDFAPYCGMAADGPRFI